LTSRTTPTIWGWYQVLYFFVSSCLCGWCFFYHKDTKNPK